jgi:predicted dehydrogenase
MEAMWMRFLPHMLEIKQIISAGVIGEVRTVTADLGARVARDPASRLFAPELGGGALLDLGVYPVSFASMVLGVPIAVKALSSPTFTGVDAQTSILLHYADGSHAVLATTLEAEGANRATVIGTDARIEVDPVFLRPTSFSVIHPDGRIDRHEHTTAGVGLRYEATEVSRCIRAGLKESPGMPLDESVQIMETLDEVRRQIRLAYPQEHPA